MRVSIAMTTYNGSRYIIQQLNSLKDQTRTADEVIIIDDHSSDDTADKIIDYINQNHLDWKFYINKENLGYKKNFKLVLSKVTGDFIFLCDQDDIWDLNKIEAMLTVIKKHPEIECLNTSYHLIDYKDQPLEDELLLKHLKKNALQLVTTREIFIKNISMGCTCCISKKVKDIYLHLTSAIAPHDWELNAIASFYDGLYYYNRPLVNYRIHSNNTTGLDVAEKNDRINSRKKNSIQIDNYLSGLSSYKAYMLEEDYHYLLQLQSFSQKRVMLLNGGNMKIWFKLMKQYEIYHQYVSFKGMLVELLSGHI